MLKSVKTTVRKSKLRKTMRACSLVCKEIFRAINNRCGSFKGTKSGLPKHELEILARHFLPQIQAFFESEEGRKEYAAWQHEQALLKAQRANNEA
jgi:hypothetical protein